LLDNFWLRMGALYGHAWASQYGAEPAGVAADTWATALSGVTSAQVAHGMREALAMGSDFPPSAPRFRAMCYGIPSFAQVRRDLSEKLPSAFVRLVWSYLDGWRFARAEQSIADKLLRDAYEVARDHIMRGGEYLAEPSALIEAKEPEPRKACDPEVARAACAQLAAILGEGSGNDEAAP